MADDQTRLLTCNLQEFKIIMKTLSAKDLLKFLATVQQEMNKEQQHFDDLDHQLQTCSKSERPEITIAMDASQSKLTHLMEKASLCLNQDNSKVVYSNKDSTAVSSQVEVTQVTKTKVDNATSDKSEPADNVTVIKTETKVVKETPNSNIRIKPSQQAENNGKGYSWKLKSSGGMKTNTAIVTPTYNHANSEANTLTPHHDAAPINHSTSEDTAEFEQCLKVSFARNLFEKKDNDAKSSETVLKKRPVSMVESNEKLEVNPKQETMTQYTRSKSTQGINIFLKKDESQKQGQPQQSQVKLSLVKKGMAPKLKGGAPTVRKSWDTKGLDFGKPPSAVKTQPVPDRSLKDEAKVHSSKTVHEHIAFKPPVIPSSVLTSTDGHPAEDKSVFQPSHDVQKLQKENMSNDNTKKIFVSSTKLRATEDKVKPEPQPGKTTAKSASNSTTTAYTSKDVTKSTTATNFTKDVGKSITNANFAKDVSKSTITANTAKDLSTDAKTASLSKDVNSKTAQTFSNVLEDIKKLRAPSPPRNVTNGDGTKHSYNSNDDTNTGSSVSSLTVKMKETKKEPSTHAETSKHTQNKTVLTPETSKHTQNGAVLTPVQSTTSAESKGIVAEEKIKQKITLKSWDPTILLEELYQVNLEEDSTPETHSYINIEGYMEKLPMNKRKATLLKTWKKRYFKAIDGNLYYYEHKKPLQGSEDLDKSALTLPLAGGSVEDLGTHIIGIDDGRGRYLMVRCATEDETKRWIRALNTHIAAHVTTHWVRPVLNPNPHPKRSVVILDLGNCSVRAGVLGSHPSLPALFFPTAVAIDKQNSREFVGIEAFRPDIRAACKVSLPVKPSVKVDKFQYDTDVFPALMGKVFQGLRVDPKKHWVLISAPGSVGDKIKESLLNTLITQMGVQGVCVADQTLLALYAYGARSGIVVDIGERLDIMPVTDGYILKQGLSRQPYGGARICDALNGYLTERKYHFFTDVERLILRLALEKSCFAASDFNKMADECNKKPKEFEKTVSLEKYQLPPGTWTEVTHDISRFKTVEGLFNLHVWGMDNPSLPKLVQAAVQASPMDVRREMWRSIYLSGGVSMLPGFQERLQAELQKLVPSSVPVEVHASPQRYHAAFIGACILADMDLFESWCITASEWKSEGVATLRKWRN